MKNVGTRTSSCTITSNFLCNFLRNRSIPKIFKNIDFRFWGEQCDFLQLHFFQIWEHHTLEKVHQNLWIALLVLLTNCFRFKILLYYIIIHHWKRIVTTHRIFLKNWDLPTSRFRRKNYIDFAADAINTVSEVDKKNHRNVWLSERHRIKIDLHKFFILIWWPAMIRS